MTEGRDALVIGSADQLWQASSRRSFLRLLGVGGSVVLLPSLFACDSDDDDDDDNGTGATGTVTLNLGTDVGILNYAFALEQLEAAFYTAVVASAAFNSMNAEQKEVMIDLRNHEVIHREFFRQALGNNRIGNLALNANVVSQVTANTDIILQTAETFEDLGVAAYNGAGKYLTDANFLLAAGKIVSVEARHAAAIRDMRERTPARTGTPAFTRFAGDDVVNAQGLDVALEPNLVLARVTATSIVNQNANGGTPITTTGTLQNTATAGPPSPTP